jgi:RNA polymerase sigma-70 factor (ECF subfamily)
LTDEQRYAGMTYEEVVQNFSDTVTRICAIRCGNLEDTKDCYQTVFLKFFLCKTEFDSIEHLRSWLIRVSITTSIDYIRQYWKKNIIFLGNDKETLNLIDALSFSSQESSPTETEAMSSDSSVIEKIFQLPLKYRQVIYLYYIEEYDINEISGFLNITPGTIKSQLSRGRKLLKKGLRPELIHKGGPLYAEKQ